CHLLVNGTGPDYVLAKVAAAGLGVEDPDGSGRFVLPPWGKDGAKPFYYPDAVLVFDHKAGARAEPVVTLRRAPRLKVRVVGPDGKPAPGVTLVQGQEPFAEH